VPFFEVLGNIKTRAFIFREQEILSNYFHGTKGTPDLIAGIRGTLKSTFYYYYLKLSEHLQ